MKKFDEFKKDVVKVRMEKARAMGIECGRTDCEGASMRPIEPQQGDWDYLNDTLKGGPTSDEAAAFTDAFLETVQGK